MSSSASSLNGLRGLASLHIALQHFTLQCMKDTRINLNGPIELPLFFLLSGFSLALAYGKNEIMDLDRWNIFRFFKNRVTRIIPTYYLLSMGSLIIKRKDLYKLIVNTPVNFVMNLFCMVTWTYPFCTIYRIGCFNYYLPASWTVHTLFFFYLCFPFVMNIFQRLSNIMVHNLLVGCFYLQLVPWCYVGHIYSWQFGAPPKAAYWLITASPLSRLPVFCMGVLAGILQTRHNLSTAQQQVLETDNFFLLDLIPIPKGISFFNMINKLTTASSSKEEISRRWQLKVDGYSLLLIFVFIFGVYDDYIGNLNRVFYVGQLVFPYIQLMVIIGLCNDGGNSVLAKLCGTTPIQLLGDISMTFYLFHSSSQKLVRNYIGVRINGVYEILFLTVLSIAASWIITVFYEVPIRCWCRGQSLGSIAEQLLIVNRWAVPKLIIICLSTLAIFYYKM